MGEEEAALITEDYDKRYRFCMVSLKMVTNNMIDRMPAQIPSMKFGLALPPREMSESRKVRVLPEWQQISVRILSGIQHYPVSMLFSTMHQASCIPYSQFFDFFYSEK